MYLKKFALLVFLAVAGIAACNNSAPARYSISDSKSYDTSLFRQHCAVCHGPEADGKTLDDGKVVPSLRIGEFKFKSEPEIRKQISEGGNGMTPFRLQLTDREIDMLVDMVHNKLRKQ